MTSPPFSSSQLQENQFEDTQYAVLALQRSINGFDGQLSYFTRYDRLHFAPDPVGDLLLNGIASDIVRQSFTNGIQGDASYQLFPAHTIRTGFYFSGETIFDGNSSLVEPAPLAGWRSMRLSRSSMTSQRPVTWRPSTRRTNGRSPTISSSMAVCASTSSGCSPTPTSSARASVSPICRSNSPSSISAMRATSPRRCWSKRHPPISRCSTARRELRPLPEPIRCCRSARIISTPASIKIFRSAAASRRPRTAPTSTSAWTSITSSRPT